MSNYGNYKSGQVIPHDALIDYTCNDNDKKENENPRHLQCKLGRIIPRLPACEDFNSDNDLKLLASGSGFDGSKASIPLSASPFIVKNGDLRNKEIDDRHTM